MSTIGYTVLPMTPEDVKSTHGEIKPAASRSRSTSAGSGLSSTPGSSSSSDPKVSPTERTTQPSTPPGLECCIQRQLFPSEPPGLNIECPPGLEAPLGFVAATGTTGRGGVSSSANAGRGVPPPPPLLPPPMMLGGATGQALPLPLAPLLPIQVPPPFMQPVPGWPGPFCTPLLPPPPIVPVAAERLRSAGQPLQSTPGVLAAANCLPPSLPPAMPPLLADSLQLQSTSPPPPLMPALQAEIPLIPEEPAMLPPPSEAPVLPKEVGLTAMRPPPTAAPSASAQNEIEPPPPAHAPSLRLVDMLPTPELGSASLPTIGSAGHAVGDCRPCAFFHTKGCNNGVDCAYCHLCKAGEKKRRMKEHRHLTRSGHANSPSQ